MAEILLFGFATRQAAGRAARRLADVPDARHVICKAPPGSAALEHASHAAAASSAARGALIAIAVSSVATAVAALATAPDHALALGLGTATTLTAAPFVGGLTGFIRGMARWNPPPAGPRPIEPSAPILLAVRSQSPGLVTSIVSPIASSGPNDAA